MRIQQAEVTECMSAFEARFRKKFKLGGLTNKSQPAIFYGCFSSLTMTKIANHTGLAVVLWAGTDAQRLGMYIEGRLDDPVRCRCFKKLLSLSNVWHIARSEYIVRDLQKCCVPFKFVPVSMVVPEYFHLCPLGENVYSYGNRRKPKIYADKAVNQIMALLEDTDLVYGDTKYAYDRVYEMYRECFIGLRLTRHDGLPNTVVEMGLMGRRCIYNGDLPNAISWRKIPDIVESIKAERDRGCIVDKEVAKEMLEYISISDDWLNTEFYC